MSSFRFVPDPDAPGWMIWELKERGRFNDSLGPFRVRAEGENKARCRIVPGRAHSNLSGSLHGGAMLSFIDVALFAGTRACGVAHAGDAVTLDCAVQFLSPGRIDEPLDAIVELLRETRRLVFVRGLVEQSHGTIAAFSGTIRKPSAPQ